MKRLKLTDILELKPSNLQKMTKSNRNRLGMTEIDKQLNTVRARNSL